MLSLTVLSTTIAVLTSLTSASPVNLKRDAAIQDSPSGSYAPSSRICPTNLAVRIPVKGAIDPQESAYVLQKTKNSLADWTAYLNNVNLEGLDVSTFVPSSRNAEPAVTVPNIGFAISGGGERAMLVGGGMLAAFDGRNATAVAAKTGGILQIAQYLVGLSGGSWLTGSYAINNAPSFESLRDEVWNFEDMLFGPDTEEPLQYEDATRSTIEKAAAGYPVSIVDAYGRLISYHLFNDTGNSDGVGSRTLWSSIKSTSAFKSGNLPFPIIIALGRETDQVNVTISSPIYEVTPYEFGVNNPELSAFVPIEFLGTNFSKGSPVNPFLCTVGFENAGWLCGNSGNIFGAAVQTGEQSAAQPNITGNATFASIIGSVPDGTVTTGRVANPFLGLSPATYPASADKNLHLVDGGLGSENVPFFPLIQPQRLLDVIIAVDASADTNNFPDGQEIYHTYQKSLLPGYAPFAPFPVIPAPEEFVALGLNQRPVFFGSSCFNSSTATKTPLIVYLPNYNIVYATNTSTFTPTYSAQAQQSFFDNSYEIVTQSESLTWSKCLACSLVDAQIGRNGGSRSPECQACFSKYCYVETI